MLRKLRSEAGFSMQGFAKRLGKSDSYLSAVELAEARCTRTFAIACDQLLNAGDALVDLWARADQEWSYLAADRRQGNDGRSARRDRVPPAGASDRRHVMTLARVAMSSAPTGPVDELSAGGPETDGVDADLAAMRAFRTVDRQVGGGHLYATVVTYLQTRIGPRLFGNGSDETGQSVFCAAAALTEMAGWMAHDAGRDARAEQHFSRALNLATVSGEPELSAHILGSMSRLAHQRGRPGEAIRFAYEGMSRLHRRPHDPRLQARLYAMEAQGLAMLREPAACAERLAKAERTLHDTPTSGPSVWVGHFDDASLASEAARCMRQLGRIAEARRQAERVVALRAGDRKRSRAFGQLILADVLVREGNLDEACAVGHEVLNATQTLGSVRVVQQLESLRQLLEPHRSAEMVSVFLACLADSLRGRMWLYQGDAGDDHKSPG